MGVNPNRNCVHPSRNLRSCRYYNEISICLRVTCLTIHFLKMTDQHIDEWIACCLSWIGIVFSSWSVHIIKKCNGCHGFSSSLARVHHVFGGNVTVTIKDGNCSTIFPYHMPTIFVRDLPICGNPCGHGIRWRSALLSSTFVHFTRWPSGI